MNQRAFSWTWSLQQQTNCILKYSESVFSVAFYSSCHEQHWSLFWSLPQWEIFQYRGFLDGCQRLSRLIRPSSIMGLLRAELHTSCCERRGQFKESFKWPVLRGYNSLVGRPEPKFITILRTQPKQLWVSASEFKSKLVLKSAKHRVRRLRRK